MATHGLTRMVNPENPGFSDLVVQEGPGRLLHIAGHVGFAPGTGELVPGGTGAEAEATLDNIAATLQRVGADLSDIVRLTVYLTDLDDYADFSAVRRRRFEANPPVSAAVGVAELLFGARIEIEGTAFIPDGRT